MPEMHVWESRAHIRAGVEMLEAIPVSHTVDPWAQKGLRAGAVHKLYEWCKSCKNLVSLINAITY